MATKKAPAKAPPPYGRAVVTAWKKVAQKVAEKGYASLKAVAYEPGTWLAAEALLDAGEFPPGAVRALGHAVCDHVATRFALPVLMAPLERPQQALSLYNDVSLLAARALRENPAALDAWHAPGDDGTLEAVVAMCRAEAGVAGPVGPEVRARIAAEFLAGGGGPPALAVVDGALTRLAGFDEASWVARRDVLSRVMGPTMEDDLAALHRARSAEHRAVAGERDGFPLYAMHDALRIAAPKLTPAEVCAWQTSFPVLQALSARWSVDEILAAAEVTAARNRPDAFMLVNSLAVLAIARDPLCAPRAEAFLNLSDHTNQASPSTAYTFEVLRRAPADWIRRFAVERVFAEGHHPDVFEGALAALLLAGVDATEAERIVAARFDDLHFWRMTGFDAEWIAPLRDGAGPKTREAFDEVLSHARPA